MVRSLGWVEIPEEELTTERSSRAVNQAIEKVASDVTRASGARKWAGGKELIMELDDSRLKLLDPDNSANVVHSERIEQIRVWGVGKTNARDFAYVARDPNDRYRFLCHVFRCDNPARVIASALHDVCSRRLAGSGRPTSLGSSFARRRIISMERPGHAQSSYRMNFRRIASTYTHGRAKEDVPMPFHWRYTGIDISC